MGKKLIFLVLILTVTSAISCHDPGVVEHFIAAAKTDKFHGWPANNGIWQWGDEILVGYTRGDLVIRNGHNISGIQESLFTKSMDGGKTWHVYDPEDFMDDENEKWKPESKKYIDTPINFEHPGFGIRVFGADYHGTDDPEGGFFYTCDKGDNWQGPFYFGKINHHPEFQGKIVTARSDYIITGENQACFFVSAYPEDKIKANRVGCLKTEDGGISFDFVSWVTPLQDDVNRVMSSSVRFSGDKFIVAYRNIYHENIPALRKDYPHGEKRKNGIEIMVSEDGCRSWTHLSTVKVMESGSNPPALILLKDGSLVCIYGDRHNLVMAGKKSNNQGKTWGEEFIIRKNTIGSSDFGYPRIVQRKDGKLVAAYYWSSPENEHEHIAVSIWDPELMD